MNDPVEFLYIGPDKAGSTWLHQRLLAHPSVRMPTSKELFFFDRYFDKGLDWYCSRLGPPEPGVVRAEISHDYMHSTLALDRILQTAPNVKMMITAREPIERAFSSYKYMQFQGRLPLSTSFRDALATVDELYGHGMYAQCVERVYERFDPCQLLVCAFDDLSKDPQSFINRVTDFLEIEPLLLTDMDREPVLKSKQPRSSALNRVGRRAAWAMRSAGLDGMVARLKNSSVVNYLTASDTESSEDLDPYKNEIPDWMLDDIAAFGSLVERDFAAEWGYV